MAVPVDASWHYQVQSSPMYAAGGDVDGDGFSDVVVASYAHLRLFLGGPNGLGAAPDWTWSAPQNATSLGAGLVVADLDGDGYAEIVVGAPTWDLDVNTGRGAVFVFRGDPVLPAASPDATFLGEQEHAELGSRVAVADIDGDGVVDLVAGSSGYEVPWGSVTSTVGAVFVWAGVEGRLPADADRAPWLIGGDDDAQLGSDLAIGRVDDDDGDVLAAGIGVVMNARGGHASPTRGTVLYGDHGFGYAIAVGDVDGDGYDDLFVTSTERGCYATDPRMALYRGSAAQLATSAAWETPPEDSRSDGRGASVAILDVDDDGYDDVFVTAPCGGEGYVEELRGGPGGLEGRAWLSAPDLQATKNTLDPPRFGRSVKSAGDVDGDGIDDLLVTADLAGVFLYLATRDDADDDGSADGDDCAPADPDVRPWAPELPDDGIDADCDGREWCNYDRDGDGHGAAAIGDDLTCDDPGEDANGLDCDDADDARFPGAVEVANDGIDQNCDGIELCPVDADSDGFAGEAVANGPRDCVGDGYARLGGDCDDEDFDVSPIRAEIAGDGQDRNCDGLEACFHDGDGDGSGGSSATTSANLACTDDGDAPRDDDCADTDPARHPGAEEVVGDGVDADCDDLEACFDDADRDGWGGDVIIASTHLDCVTEGASAAGGDCDDADPDVHPEAAEGVADGADGDCDGREFCHPDGDGDGHGSPDVLISDDDDCDDEGESVLGADCNDHDPTIFPGADDNPRDGRDGDCTGGVVYRRCGCGTSSAPSALWFALIALATRRRRR